MESEAPGRVVPAREVLGEMLLELKQPAAALKEFEQSKVREPNRLRGYAGAGERDKACQHYAKLIELTRDAAIAASRKAHDVGVVSDGVRDGDRSGVKLGRFFVLVVGSSTAGRVDK